MKKIFIIIENYLNLLSSFNALVKKIAYTFVPENLRAFAYKKIRNKDHVKPEMDMDDRKFLNEFYLDDVLKLQQLLRRSLPWSILDHKNCDKKILE